jgi:hypothetical protein
MPKSQELIASGASTASQSTGWINGANRPFILCVDITAVTATPSITPKLEIKDPSSDDVIKMWEAAAALTTVGKGTYYFASGADTSATLGDITEVVDLAEPSVWRLTVTHADADSITYSVGVLGRET